VTNEGDLTVCVCMAPDDDAEELAEVTQRLRAELLDLDVQAVDPVTEADVREGPKDSLRWQDGSRCTLAVKDCERC
jgi:hypothetical protein